MEDPSVEASSTLTKKEIMAKLGLIKSKSSLRQLQVTLRRKIESTHPLNDYVNGLERKVVNEIYMKICKGQQARMYERKKKSILERFFNQCGKAPLSSLKWFVKNGRFIT